MCVSGTGKLQANVSFLPSCLLHVQLRQRKHCYVYTGPDIGRFDFQLFDFTRMQKPYTFSENHFEF